jgi:hypothetical protein
VFILDRVDLLPGGQRPFRGEVWAHHILGLSVSVQGIPSREVTFGGSSNPQVVIQRKEDWESTINSRDPPSVYLLDRDMNIVWESIPEDNEMIRMHGIERIRLKGTIQLF